MNDDSGLASLPPQLRRAVIAQRCVHRCDEITKSLDTIETAMRWLAEHDTLQRSVLVVDDSPSALLLLVTTLAPIGVPLHVVTTDKSEAFFNAARAFGGHVKVHAVDSIEDASRVWDTVLSSVAVCDLNLGRSRDGSPYTGMDVLASIGDRGVRSVLVTSCDEDTESRESVERVARRVHAQSFVRTLTGQWSERLREEVADLVDILTPRTFDA